MIAHLVGPDTPSDRIAAIRALPPIMPGDLHVLIELSPRPRFEWLSPRPDDDNPDDPAPESRFDPARVRPVRRRIADWIDDCAEARFGRRPTVLHVATCAAFDRRTRMLPSGRGLVIDGSAVWRALPDRPGRPSSRGSEMVHADFLRPHVRQIRAYCDHDAGCRTLGTLGYRELETSTVRPGVEALLRPPTEQAARAARRAARSYAGLPDEAQAVLLLPPIQRRAGAFTGAWAAMLAQKVLPRLRLLLPGGNAEAERIAHLVRSCRHDFMLGRTGDLPLTALLNAADAAMFLAQADTPHGSLAAALHHGLPLVASGGAAPDLLAAGRNSILCDESPKAAAGALLRIFDNLPRARAMAATAQREAAKIFSAERFRSELAGLLRRLAPEAAAPGAFATQGTLAGQTRTHAADDVLLAPHAGRKDAAP